MENKNTELHENDTSLFAKLSQIIEQGKKQVFKQVNSTITLTYWHIGSTINRHILNNKRADYAKEIVPTLSTQLKQVYGRSFEERNLRRMMQFANDFAELEIVSPLATQLSWSHFIELLPLKTLEEKVYYANKSISEQWSKRDLRYQIERKAFERQEIANMQVSNGKLELQNTFKDPYLLDFLGLKNGYLEKDLEDAIINELEHKLHQILIEAKSRIEKYKLLEKIGQQAVGQLEIAKQLATQIPW